MATILRELSNTTYTSGKAVGIFYPHDEAPMTDEIPPLGFRFGDPDTIAIQPEVGETIERFSREHNVPTVRLSEPGSSTVTVTMSLAQSSDLVRAASVMGTVNKRSQEAKTAEVRELGEPGVYYLGGHFVEITDVVKDDDSDAVLGTDYLIDSVSGQIETLTAGLTVTFDQPALTTGFMTGIASGSGIRGMLIVRMVNKQGQRSIIRLHDVVLRPSGARQIVVEGTEIGITELTGTAFPVSGKPLDYEIGYEMDITEETPGGI